MNKKKEPNKTPPIHPVESVQYDLFCQFVANDKNDISNTVEAWESIPKYFFTPQKSQTLRTASGHADPYKWEYEFKGVAYTVKIQPALIEQKDGGYKAFFPSVTEELVEESLKKIFTDQQYGIHDPKNKESWVRFTLSMIQKELKSRNRTRSRNEIKHAIEVMSSCIITLYKDSTEIWKGSILQDLTTVGRKEYLADTDAQHAARLPLFISYSIGRLEYRQFNYDRLMSCDQQLTRWIYKLLINRFKQASLLTDYHFMYSKLARDSGLLQQGTERKNRQKVKSSLDELKERGVLMDYKDESKKDGKKIIDVKYIVTPSSQFSSEQKAANKRNKDIHNEAKNMSISLNQPVLL